MITKERKIIIGHLYPDLLNLYGDRGNIVCLAQRCRWRNILVEIRKYNLNDKIDFKDLDIVFLGGGSDREQQIVCNKLKNIREDFRDYMEDFGTTLAVCGGFQLLGSHYKTSQGTIKGLNLIDLYTEQENGRLIGNIILESDLVSMPIVGFENHSGRTYINTNHPLGKVKYGHGNRDNGKYEGVVYKNTIGTYLHGPLLPKNPQLCDWIIARALDRKYGNSSLIDLDDTQEAEANSYICSRFLNRKHKLS